jgi:hypothetical protein
MTEDRRKHRRVPAPFPCVIRADDGEERPFELVDLSESGVRLKCAMALPAMTRIHVALKLPAGRIGRDEDERLETVGVIVWSHRIDDDVYDTGVFFPELDPTGVELLQAYVMSAV